MTSAFPTRFVVVATAAALATTSCTSSRLAPRANASTLDGVWRSEGVQLVRGSVDETYVFEVRMPDEASGSPGVMLISYGRTSDPTRRRVIEQAVRVEDGDSATELVLVGRDPRLVSGPPFVGVYEPDTLACSRPPAATPDRLECGWGSDGHGDPVAVTLTRDAGG